MEHETSYIPEEKLDEHIARGQMFLQGVVEALYGEDRLDIEDLENCMEELLELFDMEIPDGELTIEAGKYRGYTRKKDQA